MSTDVVVGQFADVDDDVEVQNKVKTLSVSKDNSSNYNDEYEYSEDYYDDEDSYDSDDDLQLWSATHSKNKNSKKDIKVVQNNASNKQKTTLQPQEKQFGKFVGKIKLEKYEGVVNFHVTRHDDEPAGKLLLWSPDAKRRAGRPYITLKAVIEEETGLTGTELLAAMSDRGHWSSEFVGVSPTPSGIG